MADFICHNVSLADTSCFLPSSRLSLRLCAAHRGEPYGGPEGPVQLQRLHSQHSLCELHQGKLRHLLYVAEHLSRLNFDAVNGSVHE